MQPGRADSTLSPLQQQKLLEQESSRLRSVLSVLVDAKVAYWMHRVDDCLAVIETVALQQFRCHKNSMEVH
jgi:hypothetical protein